MKKAQSNPAGVTRDVTHRCSDSNVVSLCADAEGRARRLLDDDLRTMKSADLPRQYPGEYNSYRAMRQRCRAGKAHLHHSLESFTKFLDKLGPKPFPASSLDRIDNGRREYSADNVRWASSATQATNRSSTIMLRDLDGEVRPLTIIARRTNQKSATLRQRRCRGWSDEEIITGKRASPAAARTTAHYLWPEELTDHKECERHFELWKKRHPKNPGASRDTFLAALTYHRALLHERWLNSRYPDEFGAQANPYGAPSPQLLNCPSYKRWKACRRTYAKSSSRIAHHEPSVLLLRKMKRDHTFLGQHSSLFGGG